MGVERERDWNKQKKRVEKKMDNCRNTFEMSKMCKEKYNES